MGLPTLAPCLFSLGFMLVNAVVVLIILMLNRRQENAPPAEVQQPERTANSTLDAADILGWEFEYARTTASEAMQDRHTMVNFYLLAAGVIASGVIAIVSQETLLARAFVAIAGDAAGLSDAQLKHLLQSPGIPMIAGTLLLWLLCGAGWFYFLNIIRLRQAWHESAKTMNQIKTFYFDHTDSFDRDTLRSAFRWTADTLPQPDRLWTVFFQSAMLIGFLNSAAFAAGGALINLQATLKRPWFIGGGLFVLGVVYFLFHAAMFVSFLKE